MRIPDCILLTLMTKTVGGQLLSTETHECTDNLSFSKCQSWAFILSKVSKTVVLDRAEFYSPTALTKIYLVPNVCRVKIKET